MMRIAGRGHNHSKLKSQRLNCHDFPPTLHLYLIAIFRQWILCLEVKSLVVSAFVVSIQF